MKGVPSVRRDKYLLQFQSYSGNHRLFHHIEGCCTPQSGRSTICPPHSTQFGVVHLQNDCCSYPSAPLFCAVVIAAKADSKKVLSCIFSLFCYPNVIFKTFRVNQLIFLCAACATYKWHVPCRHYLCMIDGYEYWLRDCLPAPTLFPVLTIFRYGHAKRCGARLSGCRATYRSCYI